MDPKGGSFNRRRLESINQSSLSSLTVEVFVVVVVVVDMVDIVARAFALMLLLGCVVPNTMLLLGGCVQVSALVRVHELVLTLTLDLLAIPAVLLQPARNAVIALHLRPTKMIILLSFSRSFVR
jgi:hypothetical protein